MKLGLFIDYAASKITIPLSLVQRAEALGFDSVWTAEAYGTDAITPLAYIAAHTSRIRLATGIAQVSARAPTMTAMQFGTLEQLAGEGRVIAGLGLSGPQVVEGWHGQSWAQPYDRMKDTVAIMRQVFRRDGPVSYQGKALSLPLSEDEGSGQGKPLKPIAKMNPNIPIWLGTGSQSMVTLTAEIADGWIPMGFCPGMMDVYRPWLDEGFRRAGGGKSLADFEIQGQVQVEITDNVQAAIDARKPQAALYIGGMGNAKNNFHRDQMIRRGYPEAAERIQTLFTEGRRDEAIAAVPDEYIDEGGLFGDEKRIAERFERWLNCGATGLTLHTSSPAALELIASLNKQQN